MGGYGITMSIELPMNMNNKETKSDMVNHPKHYTQGKLEVVEIIEDQKLCYHLGNVVKYVLRSPYKGRQLEDLRKAVWYLNRKIELIEKQKNEQPNQR